MVWVCKDNTTVITAKAYEPHIVWQKPEVVMISLNKSWCDAMAVDFTVVRDGGSDTRVLRIDANTIYLVLMEPVISHIAFMSVYRSN